MIRLLTLALLLMTSHLTNAQNREHLFEEQEVFEMDWKEGSMLFVNGEQAEIIIRPHKANSLKCIFTRYSQHSERIIAEEDLELMTLYRDEKKNSLSLRNYVKTRDNGDKPEARLRGKFVVYIPDGATSGLIRIWNYFGTVRVKDLNCDIELKLEFSNLRMDAVASEARLEMKYGEAELTACTGDINFTSNRTDVTIDHHRGILELNSHYSELTLKHLAEVKSLQIKAKKSELYLDIPMITGPSYTITTTNTEVTSLVGLKLEGIIEEDKVKLFYQPKSVVGIAQIQMETGKLNYIVK